jgi:23S rRNA pseudouridine2604 synthase
MNSIYTSAKFYLVQKLGISNKEAIKIIIEKRMLVNGVPALLDQEIELTDILIVDGEEIKKREKLVYLAYHKPRGVECTMNTQISNNLKSALNLDFEVFPVGRLDKDSEGLLLLTNDGKIYNKIINSSSHEEKEYHVTVDKPITDEFLQQMADGVVIMGELTRKCTVYKINEHSFGIILTQGLNRQKRRMCYKLDYKVLTLKRIRVIKVQLNSILPGEWIEITKEDIF